MKILLLICILFLQSFSEDLNIGIIGAGIAGTSTAYFLNEKLPNAKITILEKDSKIGGRV